MEREHACPHETEARSIFELASQALQAKLPALSNIPNTSAKRKFALRAQIGRGRPRSQLQRADDLPVLIFVEGFERLSADVSVLGKTQHGLG